MQGGYALQRNNRARSEFTELCAEFEAPEGINRVVVGLLTSRHGAALKQRSLSPARKVEPRWSGGYQSGERVAYMYIDLCTMLNGVRRPRQIRGPNIRANVPPKRPC